jgi:hypothetical protein
MQKKPILLALFAILSFLAWRHFTATPPPTPPTPVTPEQEVAAVTNKAIIFAGDLATICEKYPKIATQSLKGKIISVSGRLQKAFVSGVNSNEIALELEGIPDLKLHFKSDFSIRERWGGPLAFRFEKIRKETFVTYRGPDSPAYTPSSSGITSVGGGSGNAKLVKQYQVKKRFLCRDGEVLTLVGEFRHIGSGWVQFDLLELPNFPG